MTNTQNKPARYTVRSLSPAAWYMCDTVKAKREGNRGQIGRLRATKAEAVAALVRLETPINFDPFGGAT
jgi:hypothetical protein